MSRTTVSESRHAPFERMRMHRHSESYAALVLDGGYEECGADGRFQCEAGMLIVHPSWHCHADKFSAQGAVVLNLPLESSTEGLTCGQVADVAAIEKLARRSPEMAGRAALEEVEAQPPLSPAPWLERLTRMLATDEDSSISEIARHCGVSPEHASRACRRWFGLSPVVLRRETRLRTAMALLQEGATPSEASAMAGFSDQPHLTRLLKRATGQTPASFARL